MRHSILACLVLVLLTAAHAAAGEEDRPGDRAGIDALMVKLRSAVAEEDAGALMSLFDSKAALAAVEEQGLLEQIDAGFRLGFRLGFGLGMKLAIGQGDFLDSFESFTVRRVSWKGDDGAEAYVRHKDADGLVQKIRWYLVKRGDDWRFYDYLDLELGLRFSLLVGVAARGALEEEEPPEWVRRAEEFESAVEAMLGDDLEEAVTILEGVDGLDWPESLEAARLVLLGACRVGLDDPEQALQHTGRALAMSPRMPLAHLIRAGALNTLGRHSDALRHAELYGQLLDLDASVLLEIGTALQGLGRGAEAIAKWQQGLEDDPTDLDLLARLLLVLPPERKGELRAYLYQQKDLVVAHSVLAETALAQEDGDALDMLVAALRSRHPGHADGDYYEGHRHRLAGAFEKAGAAFARGWPKVEDPEERAIFVDWYLDAMIRGGKPVEAFRSAPDQDAALERIVADLVEAGDDDALAELAAAAAAAKPPPRGLGHLRGALAYRRGDFPAARAHLEGLRGELAKEAPPVLHSPEGEAWGGWSLLWSVEDRLIRTYLRLERFADARTVAEEISQRDDDVQYLVVIHVVKGDVDAAAGLAKGARAHGQDLTHLLEDEDVGEILAQPAYARLREALAD